MINIGTVTTTPGTPVKLGGQVRCSWIIIQWKSGNMNNMYVGGPKSAKPFSASSPAITTGNSVTLPNIATCPCPYSLDSILVDSDNAGAVLFLYGVG